MFRGAADGRQKAETLRASLSRFDGADSFNDVVWQCLSLANDDEQNEDGKGVAQAQDAEEKGKSQERSLSMVIDFEYAHTYGTCERGHLAFCWSGACAWENVPCVCGEQDESSLKLCRTCEAVFCKSCAMKNVRDLERESEMNMIKARLIRSALQKQPWLSLDIMTAMPRKAALEKLVQDIQGSGKSLDFAVFLLDIDNLKAMNSALGHEGADRVIADVGKVLKAHVGEIKARTGKFLRLKNAWCFRLHTKSARRHMCFAFVQMRHTHAPCTGKAATSMLSCCRRKEMRSSLALCGPFTSRCTRSSTRSRCRCLRRRMRRGSRRWWRGRASRWRAP